MSAARSVRRARRGAKLLAIAALASGFESVACGTDTVVAVSRRPAVAITPTGPAKTPAATGLGYLHTRGGLIYDDQELAVRLVGVSWFGLETTAYAPHGLGSRSMASLLDQIKSLGFAVIRIPYSDQLFDPGSTPNGFDPNQNQNTDLAGLDGLGMLDKLVDGARARGLKVILDRHQAASGSQEALWYTDQYPQTHWIADFEMLAARYADDQTVVGIEIATDVRDPATWGDANPDTDFRLAAVNAGNAILKVNPKLLVIVEGVQHALGTVYWRGGNLTAAAASPVVLDVPGQLVYATQDYPESVVPDQSWFHDPSYPENLPSLWEARWEYLVEHDVAPVFVAGFGTRYRTDVDRQWLGTLVNFLADRNLSFSYWCLNPDSDDTGGILEDDWTTVHPELYATLAPILVGSAPR